MGEFPELIALSLLALLVMLFSGKVRPSLAFSGLLLSYYLIGLISFEKLSHNFVNPALVTLLLLLLISVAVEKTTVMSLLSRHLIGSGYRGSLLRLTGLATLLSSILNNTAVVASLLGVVKQNRHHSANRLLLPLSYAAILGGTMTLIGTSTNLLVNGLVIEAGLPELHLLDFVWVGLPAALVGLTVVWLFHPLLPKKGEQLREPVSYLLEAVVELDSPLVGKSIEENGLRQLEYLFLAEVLRGETLLSPVAPDEVIQVGDVLIFTGDVQQVKLLSRFKGLKLSQAHDPRSLRNFTEVIVASESTLVGRTIKDSRFRTRFDASVVALRRGEQQLSGKIANIALQSGDTLVLAVGRAFASRENLKKNFYFVGDKPLENHLDGRESWWVIGGFLGAIVLGAVGVWPLLKLLALLLALFVVFGFVQIAELKRRFPYEIFLIVGSAIGISQVVESSGMAALMAEGLQMLIGSVGTHGVLIAVFILTYLTTELVTNNAAAALIFPIGYQSALHLGVDPMPFVMAVAYGASASFLTPYGYQTNLMVFGAGSYRMMDYVRYGVPVALAYGIASTSLIPIFFPF